VNQIAVQAKQSVLMAAARIGFIDPVTGEGPSSEEQLGAALSYFHQTRRIDWQAVPVKEITNVSTALRASEVISDFDVVITGRMPAGLLFVSRDQRRVVLIQSKIGTLTYSVDPTNGEIGSQFAHLRTLRLPDRRFILLSSGRLLDQGWYFNEVSDALRVGNRASMIRAYVMRWEAVLSAVTPAQYAVAARV
jgi:hypothetical protein